MMEGGGVGWGGGCGAMHLALGSNSKAMKRTWGFFFLLGMRVSIPSLRRSDADELRRGAEESDPKQKARTTK